MGDSYRTGRLEEGSPLADQSCGLFLSPANGILDRMYAEVSESAGKYPAMPQTKEFDSQERFVEAAERWKAEVLEDLRNLQLPVPVASEYHRTRKGKKISKNNNNSIGCQQIHQLDEIIIEGTVFEESDTFQVLSGSGKKAILIKDYISKDKQWSSTLISAPPQPWMYKTYEEFRNAYDRWMKVAKDESNLQVTPKHPHEILDSSQFAENTLISRRPSFIPAPKIDVPDLSPFMSLEKPVRALMCLESIIETIPHNYRRNQKLNPVSELPHSGPIRNTPTLHSEAPQLEMNVIMQYLELPIEKINLSTAEMLVINIIDLIRSNASLIMGKIMTKVDLFEKVIMLFSIFSKKRIPLIDFGNEALLSPAMSRPDAGWFIYGHNTLSSIYLMNQLIKILNELGKKPSSSALKQHTDFLRERTDVFIEKFGEEMFSWMVLQVDKNNVRPIAAVLILCWLHESKPLIAWRQNVAPYLLGLLSSISNVSAVSFRTISSVAILNPVATLHIMLSFSQTDLSKSPHLSSSVIRLVADVFNANPETTQFAKSNYAWVTNTMSQIYQLFLESSDPNLMLLAKYICKYYQRAVNTKKLNQKLWLHECHKIQVILCLLIPTMYSNPKSLQHALQAFAATIICPQSYQYLVSHKECIESVIRSASSEDYYVSRASWMTIRKLLMSNTSCIQELVAMDAFKVPFVDALSKITPQNSVHVIRLLAEITKKLVLPDAKGNDPSMHVGIIFILSSISNELMALLQLVNTAEFQPFKYVSLLRKIPKDRFIMRDYVWVDNFIKIIEERSGCLQVMKKLGQKGTRLVANSKEKQRR